MKVILISGKAGHGKDTLAGYMKKFMEMRGKKVLIIHYGDLLKYICKSLFGWDGKKDEKGRTLLQYVGTERVRALYPDYWVHFVKIMLDIFHDEWDYVLIPDVRFPNEIKGMASFDPYIIRVVRPGFNMLTEKQQKHASETALDGFDAPFLTVMNDGSLEHLEVVAYEVFGLICDE
jgi:hypothetical protein